MKHGPIALIDQFMPVVFVAMKDSTYEKVVSNIEEVVARDGVVIVVTDAEPGELDHLCEHVIHVPKTLELLSPLLTVIPLQLLSYHIAVLRGCDVDQPTQSCQERNGRVVGGRRQAACLGLSNVTDMHVQLYGALISCCLLTEYCDGSR